MRNFVIYLVCLFLCFCKPSKTFAQQALIDSLQHIIDKNQKDTLYAKALVNQGIALERSDLKRSVTNYLSALRMPDINEFDRFKANAALRLAGNFSAMGKLDSVDYYFDLAERFIGDPENNQRLSYPIYTAKGIHYNRIGQFEQALMNYRKVLELDPSIIGQDNLAGTYINLSNVYKQIGDEKSTLEVSYKALEIFEKTQNKTGLAFAYNSLGTLHYHLKNYKESQTYLLKSLEYRKSLGDKRGEAMVLANLGNNFMDLGDHSKAEHYFLEALEMQQQLGLKEMVGIQYYNLGKNALSQEKYAQAVSYFEQAKTNFHDSGVTTYQAKVLADLGHAQQKLEQKKDAYQNLFVAKKIAMESKRYDDAVKAFKNLKEYYLKEGYFKEALEAQSMEYAYRDSMGVDALQAQLLQLESKYLLDLKENEISLLKAEKELDQVELSKRKANQNLILAIFFFLILLAGILVNKYRVVGKTKRLLEVERLRNAIARDLHDDLGSTLSSIHILSQMALQREKNGSKPIFSKINTQTASMMDKLSDIVWSIHPDNDNLDQLLSKMQEFAAEILEPKEITYEFEVSEKAKEIKLDLEKRRNLFLIFKEALNNAAKYADSHHLDIRLTVEAGKLTLLIKDDGKGFDQELIKKGNGLFNMQQRATMMGGNMVIESFPEMGTSIQLTAPIA